MANVQKFIKASLGHMLGHYDRTNPSEKMIRDPEMTKCNYNLCEYKGSQLARIHEVVGDKSQGLKGWAKCQNRADVNVMCTWCVTMPKDLDKKYERIFFQETYNFLKDRYGVEDGRNIISSYVHLDEASPHMHFAFVPIVRDLKKNRWKVSAKERIEKKELQSFHTDLQRHLEQALGVSVSVLNEGTAKGNKSVEELKKLTVSGQVRAIKEQAEENKKTESRFSSLSVQADELESQLKKLSKDKQNLESELSQHLLVAKPSGYVLKNERIEQALEYLRSLKEESGLFTKSGSFKITKPARDYLVQLISDFDVTSRELRYKQNESKEQKQRVEELSNENESLRLKLESYEDIEQALGTRVWQEIKAEVKQIKQRQRQVKQSQNSFKKDTPYRGR